MNISNTLSELSTDLASSTNTVPVITANPGDGLYTHITDFIKSLHKQYITLVCSSLIDICIDVYKDDLNPNTVLILDEFEKAQPDIQKQLIDLCINRNQIPEYTKIVILQYTSDTDNPVFSSNIFKVYSPLLSLTPKTVDSIFADYLADNADAKDTTTIEGICHTFLFDNQHLNQHENEIMELLMELPDNFRKSVSGGWSFLMACNDRHNRQWTGEHLTMEKLFALGMAINKVTCLMPKTLWSVLPGGMPYYMIEDES